MPTGVFPDAVVAAARASLAKWRIPASVSLAQWALESSWGAAMPPGSNNCFGIKAVVGQPSVSCVTHEDVGGRMVGITAKFRAFASIGDAFDQHAQLLATSHYYEPARAKLPDANAFAEALTGVYATDHLYDTKLRSIMKAHDLYQWDRVRASKPVPETAKAAGVTVSHDPGLAIDKPTAVINVRSLQEALSDLGYYCGPVGADFGKLTEAAVKGFQLAHGRLVDGIVGDATRAAIGAAEAVKAALAPPAPSPGLGRIPEPPSLLPPGASPTMAPSPLYVRPEVPGPHLVPAVSRPGFWARIKAAWQGKAA